MAFRVLLTLDAARDLEEIYDYIAEHNSLVAASHVLDRIEKVVESLATFPNRGNHPKELLAGSASTAKFSLNPIESSTE